MRRARRAAPRAAAARHRRGHLARHHRHFHLRAGALQRCTPTSRAATRPMRDSARFHFGFTVPYVPHTSAADGDRGGGATRAAISACSGSTAAPARGAWWTRLAPPDAPRSSPACLSSSARTTRPALPVFVISKPLADAAAREVVLYAVAARALARRAAGATLREARRRGDRRAPPTRSGLSRSRRASRASSADDAVARRSRRPARRRRRAWSRSAAMPTVSAVDDMRRACARAARDRELP